jgi:hypothetical protein
MTPIYLNTTRVRAREGYSCVCRHHPSSVIGGDPRERGVSRPRPRPQDFPGRFGAAAVPMDSPEASARCLMAWSHSNESTAFLRLPRATACLPSSHAIPRPTISSRSERIIESHQAGCHHRPAVTETAGRVGRKPARRPGHRWRGGTPSMHGGGPAGATARAKPRLRACPRNFPVCHLHPDFHGKSRTKIEILLAKNSEKPGSTRCFRWKNYRGRK